MKSIYLDHAASSPVHPDVIEEMVMVMNSDAANPSSIHRYGRVARSLVDTARKTIADNLGVRLDEIIFTSGGTEADNLAVVGVAHAYRSRGNHIITTKIEHHAVLNTCKSLEKQGFDVTYLDVNEFGLVSVEDVKKALRDDTILISIMLGNNEVGVIQPLAEIAELTKEHQALVHTDAVQAYGILPIDIPTLGVDLLSVSSHKINGPKGMGFLYARQTVKLTPQSYGGEQERKRRAGTENVPAIAGFAKAVQLASVNRSEKQRQYLTWKQLFLQKLDDASIPYHLNSGLEMTLPHILNISFPGTDVESLLVNLDMEGVAVSSGSACTAGSIDPSHVLVAMFGKDSERVRNSIRFSFGYNNTTSEIEVAADKTVNIVKRLIRL